MKEGYKKTELGWIPEEWEVRTIGKVTDIVNGCTPKTNVEEYWKEGNIKWATPTDITKSGKYICDTDKKITKRGFDESSLKLLPIGSILMSSRATIGERCINTIPMCTNQGFKSLICKDNINNEFMYYYIDILKDKMVNLSSGSTFLELSKNTLSNLKIVVPPLEEQQKIAEILSTVDLQIDDTNKLIEKTKELKKGLMQRLLTKGIGHSEFKKSEVGEIPVEWTVERLIDISNGKGEYGIGASATTYIEGKPRYLRITDIGDSCDLLNEDIKGLEEETYANYLLKENDVVFARTGNTTGKSYVYKRDDGLLVFAGFLIKFSINEHKCDVNFLKYIIQSKRYWDWIKVMSTRSGQPGINSTEYANFKVQLPNIIEQKQISDILSSVDNQILKYENKKIKLEELKKGLMQQLLTGKIRVV